MEKGRRNRGAERNRKETEKRGKGESYFPFKNRLPGDLKTCSWLSHSETVLSFYNNSKDLAFKNGHLEEH